jgi:hypothetical protein
MARTITTGERNLLATRHVTHFLRVRVANAAGTLVDLRSVGGANYQLEATVVSAVDTPADTATVTVRAGVGSSSIAPLMSTASANSSGRLLDVGRAIVLDVATLAPGGSPSGGDWKTIFDGTIDTIAQGSGQRLTLSCRNRMLAILDVPSVASTAILSASAESMIASLLTLGLGGAAPTLVTPSSPGWSPAKIEVRRGDSIWAKIAQIADQLGWMVRYRWDGNTPELRFYAPNRSLASANFAIGSDEVAAIVEASLDLSSVRNDIQVGWRSSPSGPLNIAQATDGASLTAYKTRPLIIEEEASSQIDTSGEANTMAAAILSDLKDPPYSHSLRHRHVFWCAEVGDILDIAANGSTHDLTQRLAVVGVEHTFSKDSNTTTLRLRGAPASRTSSWLTLGGSGEAQPPAIVARVVTQSDGARTRVQVDTVPAGGTVQLLTSTTATRLAGLAAGTPGSAPQTWDFAREAFGGGQRNAEFRGTVAGLTDDDAVIIEEQGRDTVTLLARARVVARTATTYTVRVSASAPFTAPTGTITVVEITGCTISGVSEGGTASLVIGSSDGDYATTSRYVDYVVTRPAAGATPGRVMWRVDATGFTGDLDSVDIQPANPLPPAIIARVTSSTATSSTVTVTTDPSGGLVRYVGGTANRTAGPGAGIDSASGTAWTFDRPAIFAGDLEALFSGTVNGVSDSDSVTITEQGRDTVPILTRARIIASGDTTVTIRVSASVLVGAPIYLGGVEPTQLSGLTTTLGGSAVTEGQLIDLAISGTDGAYSGPGATPYFRDFVVAKPVIGAQPARVTFRCFDNRGAPSAGSDADSVDIPARVPLIPYRVQVLPGIQSGASYTLRFRLFRADGSAKTGATSGATSAVFFTEIPASGSESEFGYVPTWDATNSWYSATHSRAAGAEIRAEIVEGAEPAIGTDLARVVVPIPTYVPGTGGSAVPRIESVQVVNTGTSSTAGDLRVVFGGVNLPSGGSYRLSVEASTFVSANVFTSASSPVTIASTVYTDGASPPTGKSVDRARGVLEMLDASGATVSSMAVPYNQFWGII